MVHQGLWAGIGAVVFEMGFLNHVKSSYGTMVDPEVMPHVEPMCCECPRGGAMFMNKLTPHMGLPNVAEDTVRWTIDLRFQKAGTATGRPFHPDFVARSRTNPSEELRDYGTWRGYGVKRCQSRGPRRIG